MAKFLLALALLCLGGALLYMGHQRQESLAGAAESERKDFASAFDGKARVPKHALYYAGGGVLIVLGAVMILRRS